MTKEYYNANRSRILKQKREYRKTNLDRMKKRNKDYYSTHKEIIATKNKLYYIKNKNEITERNKMYCLLNKKKVSERIKKRREENPLFRMRLNLGAGTSRAFNNIKLDKPAKTEILLGANYDIVKKHLENQFVKDMAWENCGDWHIDHIIPLASAKDLDELIALCHYTNLQPLWAKENLSKKNRLDWQRLILEKYQ